MSSSGQQAEPNARVSVSATQAQHHIPQATLNSIYSALLSNGGISKIDSSLTHDLQCSGWLDKLTEYVRELYRTGECTTVFDATAKATAKIRADGNIEGDGTAEGANGTNATTGNTGGEHDINLALPKHLIQGWTKTVRKELANVCEITSDGDKSSIATATLHLMCDVLHRVLASIMDDCYEDTFLEFTFQGISESFGVSTEGVNLGHLFRPENFVPTGSNAQANALQMMAMKRLVDRVEE